MGTSLPDLATGRWVVARKIQLLNAIKSGTITFEEALEKYSLSDEELKGWSDKLKKYGRPGLKVSFTKRFE